mmetsp:Transcript_7318/g.21612  ORF Transcript_7318/g.21612 Transcript_7318/m.21612 type:complete len:112 (-) Transcript_7318:217-552(-)
MLCGDVKSRGTRLHSGLNTFITVIGNHTFDLTESLLPAGATLTFFVLKVCGDMQVVLPPNATVEYHSLSLCGDRDVDMEGAPSDPLSSAAPHIKIWFIAPFGNFRVTQSTR